MYYIILVDGTYEVAEDLGQYVLYVESTGAYYHADDVEVIEVYAGETGEVIYRNMDREPDTITSLHATYSPQAQVVSDFIPYGEQPSVPLRDTDADVDQERHLVPHTFDDEFAGLIPFF